MQIKCNMCPKETVIDDGMDMRGTLIDRGWAVVRHRFFCGDHMGKNIPTVPVRDVIEPGTKKHPAGYHGRATCPYCLNEHIHGSPFDPEWGDERYAHCAVGILKYRLTAPEVQGSLNL